MKLDFSVISHLLKNIPHEVSSLLNLLNVLYPKGIIDKALILIDSANGISEEKAKAVSKELVKLGLSASRANLLIEILVALSKFIKNNNKGENAILKALSEGLKVDTAKLNKSIQENK
jgi:hypothetical protein